MSSSEVSSDSVFSCDDTSDIGFKINESKNLERQQRRIEKAERRKEKGINTSEDDDSSEVSSDSEYSSDAHDVEHIIIEDKNNDRCERRAVKAKRRRERLDAARQTNKCNQCVMGFATKANLVRHIKVVHDQLRPYKCEICLRPFSQRWYHNKHTKKCSEKFDKLF